MIRCILCTLILLAGCGAIPSQNELTNSRFAVLSDGGFTDAGRGRERSGEIAFDDASGGVAYRIFVSRSDGLVGEAGVLPQTRVRRLRDGGYPQFNDQYDVIGVDDMDIGFTSADGAPFRVGGPITLIANFEDGRLRGSVGTLGVEGRFEDETLGGWAAFRGVRGALTGLMGGDDAIGALQGDNRTLVLTVGFVAGR